MLNLCQIIENDIFHGKIPMLKDYLQHEGAKDFFEFNMLNFDQVQEITIYSDGRIFYKHQFNQWREEVIHWPIQALELIAQVHALQAGVAWNITEPFVSFEKKIRGQRLRISLVHPELTADKQVKMNLRFINQSIFDLQNFANLEQINTLKALINNKENILVVGPTGSGKTSLLNSMLRQTSIDEHLVILEDTQEITPPHKNTTQLLSRNKENYQLEDYCKYAMRLSPNRLVLGEIRSSEVTPFVLLMNSGHRGLMASLHANSAKDAINRMATLMSYYAKIQGDFNNLLKIVSQAVDYVVYVESGKICEIIKINGSDNGVIYFEDACSSFAFEQAS
jgi:type IV secretion system protein VirB11